MCKAGQIFDHGKVNAEMIRLICAKRVRIDRSDRPQCIKLKRAEEMLYRDAKHSRAFNRARYQKKGTRLLLFYVNGFSSLHNAVLV